MDYIIRYADRLGRCSSNNGNSLLYSIFLKSALAKPGYIMNLTIESAKPLVNVLLFSEVLFLDACLRGYQAILSNALGRTRLSFLLSVHNCGDRSMLYFLALNVLPYCVSYLVIVLGCVASNPS